MSDYEKKRCENCGWMQRVREGAFLWCDLNGTQVLADHVCNQYENWRCFDGPEKPSVGDVQWGQDERMKRSGTMADAKKQCGNCKWLCDVGTNGLGWCVLREVHYQVDNVCRFHDARESSLEEKKEEGEQHAE